MKPLSLKLHSFKEPLTRQQMKNITGGVGGAGSICTYVWETGGACSSGYTKLVCNNTLENCQASADRNCIKNDCCHTVICESAHH